MTAWSQPGFDFDVLTEPPKETFQCAACGAVEPDLFNMGKHGGIVDMDGYKQCLRMSNTEAIMRTYMSLFMAPDDSHCCAFRYDLGHPRDQEPTIIWRREHYERAYQEAAKAWARAFTPFHLRLLDHAMRLGFNSYLTELLFKNSGIAYVQSRITFGAPDMQLVEVRCIRHHHAR